MKYSLQSFLIVVALLPPVLALTLLAVQRQRIYERERRALTVIQPARP